MESKALGALILAGLRAVAWAYGLAPAPAKTAMGRALGALLRSLKLRSDVVNRNLGLAYPAAAGRRAELYREAYAHLGQLGLEVLLLLGPMRRLVLRHCELRGAEHWRAAKARGKGVLFLSSHVGNWEVMAATGAIHGGMDLMLVTKRLKPEWFHQAIEKGRARCGVSATYEPRTLRDVLRHLKGNGTVGIVLDQYAGPPVGVRVPVFDVPVGTSTALAALAKRTGAAVLPVVNHRSAGGRWVIDIRPPIPWEEHENAAYGLAANTARYSRAVESDVREHPEQWLWIHRRFKGDLSPLRESEWSGGRVRE